MNTARPTHALLAVSALLFLSLSPAAPAQAPGRVERASIGRSGIDVTALQPGKEARAAVLLEIRDGFHAQSNTPRDPLLIPFTVTLDAHPAIEFAPALLPAGEDHDYPELGTLNVYTGEVVTVIPLKVKPDAPLGATKITGTLRYQICDDKVCYQPTSSKFEIDTKIVAASDAVAPAEQELFGKARVIAAPSRGTPSPPSGGPAKGAAAELDREKLSVFGFDVGSDAYVLAFVAAFVVGIIFNVVPCVLPVLPLKAMGFYEVSQHNRAKCLAFGTVFSLGIVAAFATLGLLVLVLKVFKWGQLHSDPIFAGVLVTILVVMALHSFGAFNVNLPSSMYAFSPRHDTYIGNFLFGILTAALSTPCTFGMFVGLLAWAATQTAAVGILLMVTVGLGMAFPYLVLSAFPELARRFPRVGPWSELVKQLMGFLLLAVAAYFAQPLIVKVTGPSAFWWVLFAIIAGAGLFLVIRAFQLGRTVTAPIVAVVLALVMTLPAFYLVRELTAKPYVWQEYKPEVLAASRQSGKVVLVEFTADWCANCHVLEAVVLNHKEIQKAVREHEVTMIKADLTADDAPGWKLLGELNASGVPLTVVYTPGQPDPARLPGIYKRDALKATLQRASEGVKTAMAK